MPTRNASSAEKHKTTVLDGFEMTCITHAEVHCSPNKGQLFIKLDKGKLWYFSIQNNKISPKA